MEIVVLVLFNHFAGTGFVRLVKNVNHMLGEIGRAIERYAEASPTDVVGDDPVFQLGRLHSSYTLAGTADRFRNYWAVIIKLAAVKLQFGPRAVRGFICGVPACKESRR
jgi:hypothetical protein